MFKKATLYIALFAAVTGVVRAADDTVLSFANMADRVVVQPPTKGLPQGAYTLEDPRAVVGYGQQFATLRIIKELGPGQGIDAELIVHRWVDVPQSDLILDHPVRSAEARYAGSKAYVPQWKITVSPWRRYEGRIQVADSFDVVLWPTLSTR